MVTCVRECARTDVPAGGSPAFRLPKLRAAALVRDALFLRGPSTKRQQRHWSSSRMSYAGAAERCGCARLPAAEISFQFRRRITSTINSCLFFTAFTETRRRYGRTTQVAAAVAAAAAQAGFRASALADDDRALLLLLGLLLGLPSPCRGQLSRSRATTQRNTSNYGASSMNAAGTHK